MSIKNTVELSKQRLQLFERISELEVYLNSIKSDIRVLVNGTEALDNGEDMLNGNSILANEVRVVMKKVY
ncbi:MAG TPA: hypothetical protein PLS87_11260 [Ferruginibacter sp.]|nr:hypothetical protein [Ferruginibacter sp.]HRO97645.1 hypothetical protein [Ferruginibacter sp.]